MNKKKTVWCHNDQKKLYFFKVQIKFVTFKMDAPEYEYANMFGFKFRNICSES